MRSQLAAWAVSIALCASGVACSEWQDRPNSAAEPKTRNASEWPVYGGTDSLQFSPLAQIDRSNVAKLEVAWTYRHGDVSTQVDPMGPSSFQATPILVDGVLYFPTPMSRIIALDPATGAEHWSFDAEIDRTKRYSILTSRAVAHWRDSEARPNAPCARRILFATIDAYLLALDAKTGEPCRDFGDAGRVDMNPAVGPLQSRGEYGATSPPATLRSWGR